MTSTSTGPSRASASATSSSGAPGSARSQATPELGAHLLPHALDPVGVPPAHDNARALLGEQTRDFEPDSARRARDDADTSGKTQIHGR